MEPRKKLGKGAWNTGKTPWNAPFRRGARGSGGSGRSERFQEARRGGVSAGRDGIRAGGESGWNPGSDASGGEASGAGKGSEDRERRFGAPRPRAPGSPRCPGRGPEPRGPGERSSPSGPDRRARFRALSGPRADTPRLGGTLGALRPRAPSPIPRAVQAPGPGARGPGERSGPLGRTPSMLFRYRPFTPPAPGPVPWRPGSLQARSLTTRSRSPPRGGWRRPRAYRACGRTRWR